MEDSIHKAWKEKIFKINYFGYKKIVVYYNIDVLSPKLYGSPPFTIILVEYK